MSFRVNTNLGALNALRNVGRTADEFGKSVTRLSTGLRIVTGADDPAGLIISENFRAQIAGLEQAIQNNQDAVNYAKTAEGALEEVARLLKDARKLAVASGNTGALDAQAIQANQNQIYKILESINRISQQTTFGVKKLLDGSAGITSTVTDAANYDAIQIGGTFASYAVNTNGTVTVQVTQAAERAMITGSVDLSASGLNSIIGASTFVVNGYTFSTDGTETLQELIVRFNQQSNTTGVNFGFDGTSVTMTSARYGSNATISFTDTAGVLNTAGNATDSGQDAIATVTVTTSNGVQSATFTGGRNGESGLRMTDNYGNAVVLTEQGNVVGAAAAVGRIEVGQASFQIGANAGQTVSLSLNNMMTSQLGVGVIAGQTLATIDVTSASGVQDALQIIDAAISQVARTRGDIGNFQRNILESNIRSLGVTRENLIATESSIRDVDMANEITNFTKLQILQQSGLAVLAQANASPQAVLSLLR
ncbi:flagellin [Fimbriimonadia bacterium ATM]|nr:MAG: flagellin [Armatimonadota bacterium]MBC6968753.1 flagellin [Armatimonadota bacterium]MCE7899882.1 flagellin [Armatimonadetes bacterium ATM1]MDL1928665.1 flagellin [Fimbriimonadia bacterium ATM]RIJ96944.1 MAG: flagellin [Armatimonadota bacterium]